MSGTVTISVPVRLNADELHTVLCRALATRVDDLPMRFSKARVRRLVRSELAFGGYEAYGHLWSENVTDDEAETIYMLALEWVGRTWPTLKRDRLTPDVTPSRGSSARGRHSGDGRRGQAGPV